MFLLLTLSNDDIAKLLTQLKSGFKCTINWNKYQSKLPIAARNWYFDYLIDPSVQGANKRFVLLFEKDAHRTTHKHKICSSNYRNKILKGYDWWKKLFGSTSKKWYKNI